MHQEIYPPFPESRYFLSGLKERGLYIIIASHRSKDSYGPTVNWLKKYHLSFDEVHLSNDKSVLFAESWAIIDDSPITLDKAASAGIIRAGLLNPWNANSAHPLFENLPQILQYIESLDGQRKPLIR
jgi:hypothetical protein